jgi:hypothetical protein
MKKLISLSLASTLAVSLYANADVDQEIQSLKAELKKLQKQVKKNKKKITKVNKRASEARAMANGNHLKFDVDFRNTYDTINYKMADGSKKHNHSLLANKLDINMKYDAGDNVRFYGTLAWNKLYGQTLNSQPTNMNNGFDWITNENANADGSVRVKEAYWLYANDTFFGKDIPWTASIGRRPSTNGLGANFREGDKRKSAIASTVNVEFDGASFRWDIGEVVGLEGAWFKLCVGRGLTSAKPRFSSTGDDYVKDDSFINSDMMGLIFVPYDNGQYSLHTNYARATGMIGYDVNGQGQVDPSLGFKEFGNLELSTIMFKAEGIGDGISDFLDDTIFFASFSQSKTSPNGNKAMLGSTDNETGNSFWIGIQMPCPITEDGRFGLEYNHGSKYWRSMTYGEDTAIGSKIATRGTAIEAYWLKPLTKSLSTSVRYTMIDYDYTGSNTFFGYDGTPMKISDMSTDNVVDKATDLRVTIRYKF